MFKLFQHTSYAYLTKELNFSRLSVSYIAMLKVFSNFFRFILVIIFEISKSVKGRYDSSSTRLNEKMEDSFFGRKVFFLLNQKFVNHKLFMNFKELKGYIHFFLMRTINQVLSVSMSSSSII